MHLTTQTITAQSILDSMHAAGDINTILVVEAVANDVLMGISYYKQK